MALVQHGTGRVGAVWVSRGCRVGVSRGWCDTWGCRVGVSRGVSRGHLLRVEGGARVAAGQLYDDLERGARQLLRVGRELNDELARARHLGDGALAVAVGDLSG
eukprot:2630404-Prymnesium_polylepis.1